jgi:hypothetical protein
MSGEGDKVSWYRVSQQFLQGEPKYAEQVSVDESSSSSEQETDIIALTTVFSFV